MVAIRI